MRSAAPPMASAAASAPTLVMATGGGAGIPGPGASLLLFRRGVAEVRAGPGGGRLDGRVAKQFLWADRDQPFLLPVDMREWLPDDHVVWVLLEVIDRLDVSGLEAQYALGGAGRRAFDP